MPTDTIPDEAKPSKTRLIRKGEHGGLHQIEKGSDATLVVHNGVKYVLTKSGVGIVHGEHARLPLPPGQYQVVVQRELVEERPRFVGD